MATIATEVKKPRCLACAAEFLNVDEQRVHYRTDWHRYNLQRQVAELPSVSELDFNEKLQLQKAEASTERSEAPAYRCDVCIRHFLSENVLRDHLTSKKHIVQLAKASKGKKGAQSGGQRATATGNKEALKAPEKQISAGDSKHGKQDDAEKKKRQSESLDEDSGSEAESWDSDAVGFEECLFCGFLSDTLEANCTHMERAHMFFIPDVVYCTDLEGLYTCIAERIALDHECLWCDRTLRSKRAAQQHMLAKQHCRLRYEDEYVLDYSDFYDYEQVVDDGSAQVPQADSSSDSTGVRYAMTPAERDELLALLSSDDAFELVLPSGVTIGHRSLVRYYRQRLRDRELPNANANRIHIGTGLARSAIAYRPHTQSQQRSVLRADELAALERRARDVMHLRRELQNRAAKLGIQNNKLQRHFRKQIL